MASLSAPPLKSNVPRTMTTPEDPNALARHFHLILPDGIRRLVIQKVLDSREAILLAMIDSLVDPQRGCWASNRYLADLVGYVNQRTVSKKLRKFKELGLITITNGGKNSKCRCIETYWSRKFPTGMEQYPSGYCNSTPAGTVVQIPPSYRDNKSNISRRSANTARENVSRNESVGFGLIPSKTKPTDKTDLALAEWLKEMVLSKSSRSPRINMTQWAKEFRLLRHHDNIPIEDIEEVLGWLEDHFSDRYTPIVRSAKSFREKWDNLIAAMERSANSKPDKVKKVKPSQLDDTASQIYKSLKSLTWPTNAEEQLPDLLQEASATLRRARLIANKRYKEVVPSNRRALLAYTRLRNQLRPELLLDHFQSAHKTITTWKAWSGNMDMFRFNVECDRLAKVILDSFKEYALPQVGRNLLQEVRDES